MIIKISTLSVLKLKTDFCVRRKKFYYDLFIMFRDVNLKLPTSQLAFTFSKLKIQPLDQGVKYVQS